MIRARVCARLSAACRSDNSEELRSVIAEGDELDLGQNPALQAAKDSLAAHDRKAAALEGLDVALKSQDPERMHLAIREAECFGFGEDHLVAIRGSFLALARSRLITAMTDPEDCETLRTALVWGDAAGVEAEALSPAHAALAEELPRWEARRKLKDACQNRDADGLRIAVFEAEQLKVKVLNNAEVIKAQTILAAVEQREAAGNIPKSGKLLKLRI
jgi:hypothetical protein